MLFIIFLALLLAVFSICVFVGNIFLNKIAFSTSVKCTGPVITQLTDATDALNIANTTLTIITANKALAKTASTDASSNAYNIEHEIPTLPSATISAADAYANTARIASTDADAAWITSNVCIGSAQAVIDAIKVYNGIYQANNGSSSDAAIKAINAAANTISTAKTTADINVNANNVAITTAINSANTAATKATAAGKTYSLPQPIPLQPEKQQPITCIDLSSMQIGFARFGIVIFWFLFVISAVLLSYFTYGILIPLFICILVGGVYLTKFSFYSTQIYCDNSNNYCYDLTSTQIGFSRLTSILSIPMTVAMIGSLSYLLYIYAKSS